MTLRIPKSLIDELGVSAKQAAPKEACGLLGGRDGQVERFYELANSDDSGEHYTMIPADQFAAIKAMRAEGLRMIGIWHSHPETPARMSEEDLRLAYTPEVAYVILSLAVPEHDALRAFVVNDGVPEEITIERQEP